MDDKYDMTVRRFSGLKEDDYQLWLHRIKAVLRSLKLSFALLDDNVETNISQKAKVIILIAFRHDPLRAVQKFPTAKAIFHKLKGRYARQPMVNKLTVLSTLLNTKPKNSSEMGDH